VLKESANWRNLPASERALYELARLDPELVAAAITDGKVTPETTAYQVTEEIAPPKEKTEPSESARSSKKSAAAPDNQGDADPSDKREPDPEPGEQDDEDEQGEPEWSIEDAKERLREAVEAERELCPQEHLADLEKALHEIADQLVAA